MAEPLQPDDVLTPEGRAIRSYSNIMRESLLALPNLVKLLYRLLRDPRVPTRSKALVAVTLGYLVTPLDLIPDIPVIGQTDDLLLIAFALNHLIKQAGPGIVVEHWDGSQDVLAVIQNLVDFGAGLVPTKVRRLLDRLAD
ncbi:MAG: YkvA family protein [Acidimicrobiia bacterium]|nr:YkvA family protein [Acidimicrobiia bacterium]